VADTDPAAVVEIHPGGIVSVDTVSPDAFGLTGISGVGTKRAETLRRADYQTPHDVAAAQPRELARLDRIGRSVAAAIHDAATARGNGTVVATGDDSLPRGDPIFIDIETDGLEPSVAWLVGVLDGDAADGHYMPFTQPEPESADHLEAFLSWADANARGRPLVAWNGWGFDFPVLEDQIRQRCPAYTETWNELYQFDPLWWATRKNGGNAALPGYDNTLETVASALGWTPTTAGIDGQTVAEIYTAYRQAWLAAADQSRVQPPDWGRLEAYCEDDVRALATIYDALDAAARRDRGTTTTNGQTTTESTQGALSDFT
jgi:Predicted exonuclease